MAPILKLTGSFFFAQNPRNSTDIEAEGNARSALRQKGIAPPASVPGNGELAFPKPSAMACGSAFMVISHQTLESGLSKQEE
jgi:hypothetical protein